MVLANRCRLHLGAVLRRSQNAIFSSSPAPSMPRRLEPLLGCPDWGWLNPSYGRALAHPTSVHHFSWWRGGDSSFGSQIASGEDVAIVEQSSSALRQEDDVGEDASEPFLGSGDGAASWVDIEEELKTMNTDEILEGGGGSVFWSTLQVLTDAIIVTFDRFLSITGVPSGVVCCSFSTHSRSEVEAVVVAKARTKITTSNRKTASLRGLNQSTM